MARGPTLTAPRLALSCTVRGRLGRHRTGGEQGGGRGARGGRGVGLRGQRRGFPRGSVIPPPTAAQVSTAEGTALAKEIGVPYFETSALEDTGIAEAFQRLGELAVEGVLAGRIKLSGFSPDAVALGPGDQGGGGGDRLNRRCAC